MKHLLLTCCILLAVLTMGCTTSTQSEQPPDQNGITGGDQALTLVTAAEAQESVENVIELILGSKKTEGVALPTEVEVGTAELITRDGVPVWDVPVYVNGTKVGDGYVNQKRNAEGKLEASYNITVTGTRG